MNIIKKILRELLVRPINIILIPIMLVSAFFVWLIVNDETWEKDEVNIKNTLWWKL